jgi:hypothetical protein
VRITRTGLVVANWRDHHHHRSGDGGDGDGELASLRSHHNGAAWVHTRHDDAGIHSGHIWPRFGRRRPRRLALLRFGFQGYIPLFLLLHPVHPLHVSVLARLLHMRIFLVVSCRFLEWFLKMVCGYKQLVNWHIGCGSGTVVLDCGWHSFCAHFEQRWHCDVFEEDGIGSSMSDPSVFVQDLSCPPGF